MGNKTPPWPDYPEWTEARFWTFIRSGIRSKWSKWPPKWEALRAAERPYVGPDKRRKKEYQCAKCGNWYGNKQVSVDHIIPAGSLKSYDDIVGFYRAIFVPVEKLQVLCKVCHDAKSAKENEDRRKRPK